MAKYYAVAKGREKGIFTTWEHAKMQVYEFKGAKYKSFSDLFEAAKWFLKNSRP